MLVIGDFFYYSNNCINKLLGEFILKEIEKIDLRICNKLFMDFAIE
jgi:hypothetical protein